MTETPQNETEVTANATNKRSGCLWGITGALGCLVILMIPFVVAVIAGTTTVNSIIENAREIFSSEPVITISANTVLDRVQTMSQLTTVRYNYSSMVTTERDMPELLSTLYGDRQVMVAVGHVNAGINLQQLTPDDITIDGDTLTLRLPPPQLQDCFLNEQQSYVVSRDTGLFASPATNMDVEARRYAVRQFRDMALEAGILDEVQTQSAVALQELLSLVDPENIQEIQVVAAPQNLNAPLPESCE
jgi:hypothetical protein